MNDYTIRICDILEECSYPIIDKDNPWKIKSVDDIIKDGMEYFFSFDFPWYTDKSDQSLNDFKNLFLRLNYLESIGQENFSQLQLVMQAKLMEIMPRYKELYKTIQMEYDPLINRKYTVTRQEQGSGNSSTNGTSTTNGNSTENLQQDTQDVHSENPEVSVADNNFASQMDRGKKKNVNTVNTKADGTTSSESDSNYQNSGNETRTGYEGESMTDNIVKYRNAILNLNKMICDELHPVCFLHYFGGMYFFNEEVN